MQQCRWTALGEVTLAQDALNSRLVIPSCLCWHQDKVDGKDREQVLTARISMARSTPMTEAAQPMPERLKVRMLCLNLKWFTTAADSDGVGLKAEQLTMRPSICRAQKHQFLQLCSCKFTSTP